MDQVGGFQLPVDPHRQTFPCELVDHVQHAVFYANISRFFIISGMSFFSTSDWRTRASAIIEHVDGQFEFISLSAPQRRSRLRVIG